MTVSLFDFQMLLMIPPLIVLNIEAECSCCFYLISILVFRDVVVLYKLLHFVKWACILYQFSNLLGIGSTYVNVDKSAVLQDVGSWHL